VAVIDKLLGDVVSADVDALASEIGRDGFV
jgi:hypothetical protein